MQSAAKAYKDAIAGSGTEGKSTSALVASYAQVLHMACLRSSPLCNIPECSQVGDVLKTIPKACQAKEYLGSQFEEDVFKQLIQEASFSDVSGQQAKVDSAISSLTVQIEGGEIGSPFLNFIMSLGFQQDTKKLVQTYYGTVKVFGDLQPIVVKYIEDEIGSSDGGSVKEKIGKVARSHSQLLKCGIAPSYFSQTQDSASTSTTLSPVAAAAASFFVPVVGVQLRNNEVIKALRSSKSLHLDTLSIEGLVGYLGGELPRSPNLKFDTRNWLFPNSAGTQGGVNDNSESSALFGQSIVKKEMSRLAGSDVALINEFLTKLEVDTSRTDELLADFMAASGLFFATHDGSQPSKPIDVVTAAGSFKIVGPIGMVFPAASEFIPGMSANSNVSNPSGDAPNNPNFFSPGAGGALEAVAPTDADIAFVLYRSATLRIRVDPAHYVDADPPIDPSTQLYILDLVAGKEIPQTGRPSEDGTLEVQLAFGSGVWAGGWGGGGAFAVGVKDWPPTPTSTSTPTSTLTPTLQNSAPQKGVLQGDNQQILAVLGWVAVLVDFVW